MNLDPEAVHMAYALYRLWRLRRWHKRRYANGTLLGHLTHIHKWFAKNKVAPAPRAPIVSWPENLSNADFTRLRNNLYVYDPSTPLPIEHTNQRLESLGKIVKRNE